VERSVLVSLKSVKMKQLLNYIGRYVSLSPFEEELLLAKVTIRKYRKGQFVLQSGDICKHEHFVLEGCLRSFYVDHDGHEHVSMFAIEDWWTGDLGSFISQAPADINIQCLEHCTLAQISYDDLNHLYSEIPALERFFRIIIQKAFVAAQKRIIHNLSLPAKDRYLLFRDKYPLIEQRVPQYMIASYLGMTKEFLSKIRQQLMTGGQDINPV
jgi:CRP-like cAMP-binding protein